MNRREFLRLTAAAAGTQAVLGPTLASAAASSAAPAAAPSGRPLVGIPISIARLVQADPAALFDDMQARAGANALFPFLYTHEPHRAGCPPAGFHGGNYAKPHPQYYHGSPLTLADMTPPEFGGVDVLARILPAASARGIAIYPFILEDNKLPAAVLPDWESMYEVDHHGRRTHGHPGGPCFNNPQYQAFMLGLVEDYARSYPIGGIMWGSERQSGVLNTLALSQSAGQDPGRTTCFCEYCQQKGRARGIDVERARQGFDAVEGLVRNARAGRRPRDGSFTAVWRILLDHPELLAWEKLWVDSRHAFQAALHQRIKSVNPRLKIGWHVWHNLSFSPFQRAEEDYTQMPPFSDFLRPALYNTVAGARMLHFIEGARESVFGDLPTEQVLEVLYRQLGYGNEASSRTLAATGLSADYVQRETRRAADGVAGTATQIWPGVDIGVIGGHTTPASAHAAVLAAFHGGAKGIILSRNYVEMKPENLSAAGDALRELKVIG